MPKTEEAKQQMNPDAATDQGQGNRGVPDLPPDVADASEVAQAMAETYGHLSAEELGKAWQEAQARFREVEAEIAGADERLREAARKDEKEFLSAGEGVAAASEPYRHSAEEDRRTVYLGRKRWALERRMVALEIAFRFRHAVELAEEMEERYPKIQELERKIAELQGELQQLRLQQADCSQERRDLDPDQHIVSRYVALSEGPKLSGLAALLTNGATGAVRSGWSDQRIVLQ